MRWKPSEIKGNVTCISDHAYVCLSFQLGFSCLETKMWCVGGCGNIGYVDDDVTVHTALPHSRNGIPRLSGFQ